jgi:hypothetical protein
VCPATHGGGSNKGINRQIKAQKQQGKFQKESYEYIYRKSDNEIWKIIKSAPVEYTISILKNG